VTKASQGFERGVYSIRGFYLDRPRGNYEEALKNLTLAEHAVWPPNAFLYRGFLRARLGRSDAALADFKKLMAIVEDSRPDFFGLEDFVPRRLLFLLGRGEARLLEGDLAGALADADEAVRFTPSSAEALRLRARVHDKQGKPDLAAADRRAASESKPDPIIARPEPTS
jgi:tetratricopeptide (TPR) repeat protein